MNNEQIFIVPYDKTMDIKDGFVKQKHYNNIWMKYNDIGIYVDKEMANKSGAMQQIIPYTLIKNDKGEFFTATLKQENKTIISMGFGDNIIQQDGVLEPLFKGAVRTLFNDIMMEGLQPMKFVGTVRDMATNPKHLGYIFLINVIDDNISLLNKSLEGKWMSKEDLINNYGKLEAWSKHIVNYMVDNPL